VWVLKHPVDGERDVRAWKLWVPTVESQYHAMAVDVFHEAVPTFNLMPTGFLDESHHLWR
jgi:hypothetical protein